MALIIATQNDRQIRVGPVLAGVTRLDGDFPLLRREDLSVIRNPATAPIVLTLGADYAVTITGATFYVTLTAGAAAGAVFDLIGNAAPVRLGSVVRGGAFSSDAIDGELDRLTVGWQEQGREIGALGVAVDALEGLSTDMDAALAGAEAARAAAEAAQAASEAAADLAEAAAALAQPRVWETAAVLEAQAVPANVLVGEILRYTAGKIGGCRIERVAAMPTTHAGWIRSADRFLPNGTVDAGNGGYWAISPTQKFRPEMIGAPIDLVFASQTVTGGNGYVRSAGTNALAAFRLADQFASVYGLTVYAEEDYFVDSTADAAEFRPTADWVSDTNYRNTIWVRYGVMQRGVWIADPRTKFRGMQIIGQYDRAGVAKPAGNGNLGAIISTGYYYTTGTQAPLADIDIDVRLCRAADTAGQNSDSNIMATIMGYTVSPKIRLGVFGNTNVASQYLCMVHWGAQYSTIGFDDAAADKTPASIIQTYHPVGGVLEFSTEIDNANGHGLEAPYVLSAPGHWQVGRCVSRGMARAYDLLPGDVADAYATARQVGQPGRAIRMAEQNAQGLTDTGTMVQIASVGTSKTTGDVYPGTSTARRRTLAWDIAVEAHNLTAATGVVPTKGILVGGCVDWVDLGKCRIFGAVVAIENEYSTGSVIADLVGSDGVVRHEFSRGGRLRVMTDRGDLAGSGSGINEEGYNTDNALVYIFGSTAATVTTADVAAGATSTPITALVGVDVYAGMPIVIGGQVVHATGYIPDGVPLIEHTPIAAAVASGAAVTVDREAYLDRLEVRGRSSEFGVVVDGGYVAACDLSALQYTGRYGINVVKGHVQLVGGWPRAVGRLTSASVYTVRVQSSGRVSAKGVRIPAPTSRVAAHFQIETAVGAYGSVDLSDCQIESLTGLIQASSPHDRVSMRGCVDFTGAEIFYPDKSLTWAPVVQIGGSNAGMTQVVNSATYLLVGDLIHYMADVTVSNIGVGTGDVTIAGLPFVADQAGGTSQPLGHLAIIGGASISGGLQCRPSTTAATLLLTRQTATSITPITNANIAAGVRIIVAGALRRSV